MGFVLFCKSCSFLKLWYLGPWNFLSSNWPPAQPLLQDTADHNINIYVFVCVNLYLCICTCVFVFVYLCICICVFVLVYLTTSQRSHCCRTPPTRISSLFSLSDTFALLANGSLGLVLKTAYLKCSNQDLFIRCKSWSNYTQTDNISSYRLGRSNPNLTSPDAMLNNWPWHLDLVGEGGR